MLGRRGHFIERPINAITDAELGFERFKVNVAGTILDRLRHQAVDQLDYRRGFVGFEEILRLLGELVGDEFEALFVEISHELA